MFGLRPLYGFEIDSFGGAGLRKGGGARVTAMCTSCAVEVLAQVGELLGPPRFGSSCGTLQGCVGLQ